MKRILVAALLISASARAADNNAELAPKAFDQKKDDSPRMFHVGAMVGLVSLPRPLDVELYARVTDYFFVGFSYSDFAAVFADPLLSAAGLKSGSTTARLDQFNGFDVDLRVFPFGGSFFLGSSFGRQSVKGAVTESTQVGPQTATLDLATVYATPRVGWLWTFGPGLTLGLDAGVQLKLSSTGNPVIPPGAPQSVVDDANKFVDVASSYPLPSFHLRLGWQY
jgi:hypothetical protein